MGTRRSIALLTLTMVAAAAGCASDRTPATSGDALGDDAVTVASFDFTESELLAELYSQALEGAGLDVERSFHLGSRELVLPALHRGLVELVPEYAGSALQFVSLGERTAQAGEAATHRSLGDLLAGTSVQALAPAPAANTNAFVVTRATADRERLRRLSDLARAAPRLTFGGPPECSARPLCLLGLEQRYGVRFQEVITLDAGGPLTHRALRNGDVDVALLFSTDPELSGGALVQLEDDRGLQPAENVTPLVRREVTDRWGRSVVDRLDDVSRRLTTDELRALNAAVSGQDVEPSQAVADWLQAEGLR